MKANLKKSQNKVHYINQSGSPSPIDNNLEFLKRLEEVKNQIEQLYFLSSKISGKDKFIYDLGVERTKEEVLKLLSEIF